MTATDSITGQFEGISLHDMDAVKLMNRTDRKYWFNSSLLGDILRDVANFYYVLEIDGKRNLPYSTTYYDTLHNDMYSNHHRGKKNRYKIRRRNYISTQSSFLEVKFKSNKGRTLKVRQVSSYQSGVFNIEDQEFIKENTPYQCDDLTKVLENGFRRLMLVSKAMNERCTIDSELQFRCGEKEAQLDNLVIVEVKSDGRSQSNIIDALNRRRLKPSGFSKYCIGRSLIDDNLKRNRFKSKHREINKKIKIV